MTRRTWIWAALLAVPAAVVGGLTYAKAQARTYTCPLTGEQLPCEKCCPLNQTKEPAAQEGYVCPATGEVLPCPKCCPLNQQK
jgi:hypothetical protein